MEDAKIIDLFWARNEDAIAETDAAYGRKLRFLANKILNNFEDAEESVSDTYMKTWEVIPPQRPVCFYAFIASICRHLSFHKVDWNRAAKRNAEVVALTDEMESLPKETRMIFLRRYWHVDTIAEIAQRYGITQSKVKMQLSRTRAKLCTYLEQEGIQV